MPLRRLLPYPKTSVNLALQLARERLGHSHICAENLPSFLVSILMVEKHFAARAWMRSEDLSAIGNRLAADSYSFRSTGILHTTTLICLTSIFTRGTEKRLQEKKKPVTLRQIKIGFKRLHFHLLHRLNR